MSVVLQQNLLTKQVTPRNHEMFPNIKLNPLDKLNRKQVKEWIKNKQVQFGKEKGVFWESAAGDESEYDGESVRITSCVHPLAVASYPGVSPGYEATTCCYFTSFRTPSTTRVFAL